jgi:membrane protein YqaA with SNARE-associated domain
VHTLEAIFKRYSAWIWGILAPLGPWGVFAIAAVDGSFMGLPMDAIVAGYVYSSPRSFLFYVVLASAGSAVGSSVIYLIGYYGGEKVLRKRISEERFARIHASFEKHEFWALMFPAMLPPPTPFKLFVLAAAIFEMRYLDFLAAIFAGRFVRFLLLAILTIKFGPQFVQLAGELFKHHFRWVLAAVALGIALYFLLRKKKSVPGPEPVQLAEKTE